MKKLRVERIRNELEMTRAVVKNFGHFGSCGTNIVVHIKTTKDQHYCDHVI